MNTKPQAHDDNTTEHVTQYIKIATKKLALTLGFSTIFLLPTALYANISNADVGYYSKAMSSAANAKNIKQVANLIAEDAIITVNRNGVAGTMDKTTYLKKLQENWSSSSEYKYSINISDVVLMGNNAKANITTTESFIKNNYEVTQVTKAKATLQDVNNKTILLKAVSAITIK